MGFAHSDFASGATGVAGIIGEDQDVLGTGAERDG